MVNHSLSIERRENQIQIKLQYIGT